jgi:IclR family mhp operon transcriptional activator
MDSTRPIRALVRGLDALTFLNSRDGATVSEIARAVSLPRTTVYRILETFCEAGYVTRDADDEHFHLTIAVRGLSNGFADDDWVACAALPMIEELGSELVWPVCFTTRCDSKMVLRATTDHHTPLAIEKFSTGFSVPLMTSAAGRVYLAHCEPSQRDALLEGAAQSKVDALLPILAEIKSKGYGSVVRTHHLMDAVAVSIPVPLADRELAVLTVRFVASAVPMSSAIERFIPKMRRCAARISTHYVQHRNAGGMAGTPAAAS